MHVSACLRDGYSLLFVVLSASCIMYGKEQSCTNKHWKACSTTNATKECHGTEQVPVIGHHLYVN